MYNPRLGKYNKEDFTVHAEMLSNTAIFCREETETTENVRPKQFKGYGHTFENEYTTSQVNGSTGHHRIISYDFGGLKLIIRHETDGYAGAVSIKPQQSSDGSQATADDLTDILESLSLSAESRSPREIRHTGSKLVIREDGQGGPNLLNTRDQNARRT